MKKNLIRFLLLFFISVLNINAFSQIFVRENNYTSLGWEKSQVPAIIVHPHLLYPNWVAETTPYINFVCPPEFGGLEMKLPTATHPEVKRVRFRNDQYDQILLNTISVLEYSTSITFNNKSTAGINLVLQIDNNGDNYADYTLYYDPRVQVDKVVEGGGWQKWDALHGLWQLKTLGARATGSLAPAPPAAPPLLDGKTFSLEDGLKVLGATTRIINSSSVDDSQNPGGGIRFTISTEGGAEFNNFIGYIESFKITTGPQQIAKIYFFEGDCLRVVDKPWRFPTYRFFGICGLFLLINTLITFLIVRSQVNRLKK